MKHKNMGVCGIDCYEKCHLYMTDVSEESAKIVLDWFKENKWCDDNVTLREFMEEGKRCYGCHGEKCLHWSPDCDMMKCCIDKKGLEYCHQCKEFPCETLSNHANKNERYKQGVERLKKLRIHT